MKPEQIFIGNIKKCTKYETHTVFSSSMYLGDHCIGCDSFGHIEQEDELYKKQAILIKIEKGGYVDLERFNSILDHIRINRDITKDGYRLGGLMMSTSPHRINSLFVDEKSLKPYYNEKQQTSDISVWQLKKQAKKQNKKASE